MATDEHVETLIIGGGQAGLAVGYHLKSKRRDFLILDANERVGDSWRKRWPSLRLYSPAKLDGLPGMAFPAPRNSYPTGLEMADYLESYAEQFELPVRSRDHRGRRWRGTETGTSRPPAIARFVRGQRRRRNGCLSTRAPDRPRFRGRARSRDPAAPLRRLPRPGAAPARAGARGRRGALGRRHRVRGCARWVPDRPLRKGHRPDSRPPREPADARGMARTALPVDAGPDHVDTNGSQGEA